MKIRSLTIPYCIRKSRQEKEVFKRLELEIQSLENSVNVNPCEINVTSLNQKKCELEKRRQTLVEGLILRSRANWHENGERCTNYFYWELLVCKTSVTFLTIKGEIFFTFDQIKHKIQSNNFMRYYSLISNIPKELKQCIGENTDTDLENFTPHDNFLEQITSSKNIKFIYNNLIVKRAHHPVVKFSKWEDELHSNIEDWKKYFCILQKGCRDT
ncbi:unnamed protein product [Mytilus coruscus]|uniref:Uncharacterized protein n=1 Tax=Mytilus coruscus TaxID=42192 RepID=A0A6J8BH46_MYTCO|nr:unnamed protein product [Mytilus coruscus]